MKNAARATKDLGSDVAREAEKNHAAWTEVGTGLLAFGAAVGVGVGMAVKKFADFDSAMSGVQAATHETAAGMDLLREAALEAGAKTAFSATEAAEGIEALAKAGVSTEAILSGGLNGALDLAAAGGLEVGAAAEIAATAMTQFGLEGSKVPHIADLLAAAAGKAQGEVSDMGAALGQVGLVASSTGLTIEETTGGLAAFASAGLIGSDAGTSFKTMLQRLNPQSAEAAGLMEELGLSAYDSQGNFIGLSEYAGELQRALSGMSAEQRAAAMSTLFGSDAVRAATVLFEQGSEGVQKWEDAVNDAGFAQETAATKLDNLKGDLEAFGGSLETALIGAGSSANGVLREMVQVATSVVNAYSALPGPMQATATGIAAVTAAAALAGGAFLVAVPKVAQFKSALGDMGPRTQAIGRGLGSVVGALGGPWGIALAAGVTALGFFANAKAEAKAEVDAFTAAIEADSGALGENARQTVVTALEKRGLLEAAETLGLSLSTVTDAALGDAAAMEQVREKTQAAWAAGIGFEGQLTTSAQSAKGLQEGLVEVAGSTEDATAAARRNAAALGEDEAATDGLTGAQGALDGAVTDVTGAVADQEQSLVELFEIVRAGTSMVLGLRDASRGYEAALDEATAAVEKNGRTLDRNTEAGRNNEEALDAIASSANDVLEAMIASGAPLDSVSKKLGEQRAQLVATAERFGMTRAQAEAYADSVLQIPEKATTTVTTVGVGTATSQIEAFKRAVAGIPSFKAVTVQYNQTQGISVGRGLGGRVTERASGGPFTAGALLVGERGPELLFPDTAGFVLNNRATLAALNGGSRMSGGAGVTVNTQAPDLAPLLAAQAQMTGELRSLRETVASLPGRVQHLARTA